MTVTRLPIDPPALRAWMVDYIRSIIDLPEDFDTSEPLASYGLDSVEAVVMAGVLEEEYGVPIDPVELVHYPSIDTFVAAFATEAPPR